jgi:lipoprotein NlpD
LALAVLVAAIVAGCTSPRPAPIVRREPPRPSVPLVREPPLAAVPGSPDIGPTGESVQTTPVRPSAGEARPLPSAAQPIAPAVPGVPGSVVRTEPNASKRPYSDALLAQMKSGAGPAAPATAAPAAPAAPAAAEKPSSSGFIWPASGQVIEGFSAPKSTGIAIAGKPGDPVVAAASGKVIFSGQGPRPYGNLVIIKHEGDTLSVYAHNRSLLVKEGANVKRGQRIAELGDSGTSSPQLHFEIRKEGKPVDPSQFLPPR